VESAQTAVAFGTPPDEQLTTTPVTPSFPVRVRVLGPAHVEAFGEVVTSGLRQSAYELLAWYVLRPEGATIEAAAAALWPDATTKRGRERFWTALGNLRSRLGRVPGNDGEPLEILAKVGEHYVPDAATLDVDLWRFEAALGDATRASDDAMTVEALSRAIASYGGDLCPGTDYLWSEPVREDLHRRCLDAYLRLAELHEEEGRIEVAVAVLEEAIDLDPICEEMYRRLVTLLGRLGHYDAALRVGTLLMLADGGRVAYDVLIGVRPHAAPEVARTAGLAAESGFIPVDRATLATSAAGVFAIGDVTVITIAGGKMLPKAGVFAHAEAEVVSRRIAAELRGGDSREHFVGHGACFVEMGDGIAAYATGDFYAEGAPDVHMRNPSRRWHALKVGFEQYWLRRWWL
jgi:DNA-binding SARP family transcriptional activator